eukprot:TRINITY_DN14893_c0_g1_i1.p1 TRINITY_DN14893_c0_g1~~TRINITY_DN14893_c0_g1_i1.p1  ORF type:complete len:523 (-),score=94.84 TRINITY_DN14893_c0_g1_i1:137-1705(-)
MQGLILLQVALFSGLLFCLPAPSRGHGGLSKPCSWHDPNSNNCMRDKWQHAGCSDAEGRDCTFMFFTNNTRIPGDPTIPDHPIGGIGDSLVTYKHSCIGETYEGHPSCDWTKRNPWRHPGSASVDSPCGIGGGNPRGCPEGAPESLCQGGGYSFGKDARKLPGNYQPEVWEVGSEVEVAWGIEANHGGGYQYRLCRKQEGQQNSELTEECFQANPLSFVGDVQWLQSGDDESKRAEIPARRTSSGTIPEGSQWTRNPIPACGDFGTGDCDDPQFPPPNVPASFDIPVVGFSGMNGPLEGLHIIDKVQVPQLEPGNYVLSWRWDCEQSAQVWSNCADVQLSAAATASTTSTTAVSTTAATTTTTTMRAVASTTTDTSMPPVLFEDVNGVDRVCRGGARNDNSPTHYGIFNQVVSLEDCQDRCKRMQGCRGIEYNGARCEVWIREAGIQATKAASGYRCMRYLGGETSLLAKSEAKSYLKTRRMRAGLKSFLKTRRTQSNILLQQKALLRDSQRSHSPPSKSEL